MKVFVWESIKHCTGAWHPEGGVVVFAETETRARELASNEGCSIAPDEAPNDVREVLSGAEHVFVFPNAGCC